MAQAQGTIVQCIGAVIDIEFPRDAMPKVYEALTLVDDQGELAWPRAGKVFLARRLVAEIAQRIADAPPR